MVSFDSIEKVWVLFTVWNDKKVYSDTLGLSVDISNQAGNKFYREIVSNEEFITDKSTKFLIKDVELHD